MHTKPDPDGFRDKFSRGTPQASVDFTQDKHARDYAKFFEEHDQDVIKLDPDGLPGFMTLGELFNNPKYKEFSRLDRKAEKEELKAIKEEWAEYERLCRSLPAWYRKPRTPYQKRYAAGYVKGYEDGQAGRAFCVGRFGAYVGGNCSYGYGYEVGFEDGRYNEEPEFFTKTIIFKNPKY